MDRDTVGAFAEPARRIEDERVDTAPSADPLTALRHAALRRIEQGHRVPSFGVDHIARELYISRRQLYRAFPDSGGIAALIAGRRLRAAEELLVSRPELPLGEIAVMSGFSTAGVMRAHFRRRFGMTPQQRRDAVMRSEETIGD